MIHMGHNICDILLPWNSRKDRLIRLPFSIYKGAAGCSFRQRGAQRQNVRGRAAQLSSRSGRWPQVRKMAWDRDRKARAVCHICGQPINYFLQPSSAPDSWEPDHLIPVAKRPDLELDLKNILASHMRCNRARGDGTNGENAIGMQSRVW